METEQIETVRVRKPRDRQLPRARPKTAELPPLRTADKLKRCLEEWDKTRSLINRPDKTHIVYPLHTLLRLLVALRIPGGGPDGLVKGLARAIDSIGDVQGYSSPVRYKKRPSDKRRARENRREVPDHSLAKYGMRRIVRSQLSQVFRSQGPVEHINDKAMTGILDSMVVANYPRVAHYNMWRDYLECNAPNVYAALDTLVKRYHPDLPDMVVPDLDTGQAKQIPRTAPDGTKRQFPETSLNAENGWVQLPGPIFKVYVPFMDSGYHSILGIFNTLALAHLMHDAVMTRYRQDGNVAGLTAGVVHTAGEELNHRIEALGARGYVESLEALCQTIKGTKLVW